MTLVRTREVHTSNVGQDLRSLSQVKHFDGCSMEQSLYQHVGQHVLASVCR